MAKLLLIKGCTTCPYRKHHFSGSAKVYEGASCTHPDTKHLFMNVEFEVVKDIIFPEKCPLMDEKEYNQYNSKPMKGESC